jgi:sigma-B regulation protein RsbU (phosphoserine phosphatase)
MLPDVQLITEPNDYWEALHGCLTDSGYCVTRTETLASLLSETSPPAIYIVDLAYFKKNLEQQWDDFVKTCRQQSAACLAYSSDGPSDQMALRLLKPAAEILLDPKNPAEVRSRMETLLTIRHLALQLEIAENHTRAQQNELEEALLSAAQIQRRLIPAQRPAYKGLKYAWHFMPSKKVGGDLFNVARLDERTVMTYLVDVSGHGISSAMVSVAIHQSLSPHTGQAPKRQIERSPYYEISSPAAIMKILEDEYPFERFEEFFTITYLLLDAQQGTIRYCSAGHPPPILIRKKGQAERLTRGGTIIGLGGPVAFEEGEIRMCDGDRLYLYTDGITEHGLSTGEAFGEQRLVNCLKQPHPDGLEGILDRVVENLLGFERNKPPQDDVTLIGIEFSENAGGES